MRLLPIMGLWGILLLAGTAEAKKFRYPAGPKPQTDSLAISEADPQLVVASRRRREAPTNMSMLLLVSTQAAKKGLAPAPLAPGSHVTLAPAGEHAMNFVIEHGLLRELSDRKLVSTVRRAPVGDDSLPLLAGNPGSALLEYQVATARVTYLALRGVLPGRTKVERQATVQATLTLRDPATGAVKWLGEADHNLIDLFPRSQQQLVEDTRYPELQTPVPGRAWQNLVEPTIVVAIVTGLVLLFFENRP
jgi:hypothetical protein